jgi:hypothetical protein
LQHSNQVTKGFNESIEIRDVFEEYLKIHLITAPSEGVGLSRHIERRAFRTLQEKILILTEAEVEMTL